MRTLIAGATLLTLVGGLAADRVQPPVDLPRVLKSPSLAWYGSASGVEKPSYQRVTAEGEWKLMWRKLAGDGVPAEAADRLRPWIDFSKHSVVAIFAGSRFNRAGVWPAFVDTDNGDNRILRVRFFVPLGPVRDQKEFTPYVIFLVPRDRLVVLEEEMDDGTVRVRARLPKSP